MAASMNGDRPRRLGRILSLDALELATAGAMADRAQSTVAPDPAHRLLAIGPVSRVGVGMISVSGYQYAARGASIRVDGHPGRPGQIRVGHIVSMLADSINGSQYTAVDIALSANVRGTVTDVDAQAGLFHLLGQAVYVDSRTTYSADINPPGPEGLKVGDKVEVSAFRNSRGDLVASNVFFEGASTIARVVGTVRSLDSARQSFYVNALKVDYGKAKVEGAITQGAAIEVEGNQFATDGALIAAFVHVEEVSSPGSPGAGARIQGLITRCSSKSRFEIDGQPVVMGQNTQTTLPVPLGLDVGVLVTGCIDTNGRLVADTVLTHESGHDASGAHADSTAEAL
jgi:hypothetical protein